MYPMFCFIDNNRHNQAAFSQEEDQSRPSLPCIDHPNSSPITAEIYQWSKRCSDASPLRVLHVQLVLAEIQEPRRDGSL